MRIAIVHDSQISLEILKQVILQMNDCSLAWVAFDGSQALDKYCSDKPDTVLISPLSSKMSDSETIQKIMAEKPCSIIIVVDSIEKNTTQVFKAMQYGAIDVAQLPFIDNQGRLCGVEAFRFKIENINKLRPTERNKRTLVRQLAKTRTHTGRCLPTLVVIGASTGGPKAIAYILSHLPQEFHATIVIIQHLDEKFSSGMIEWWNTLCPAEVLLAEDQMSLSPGKIYVAGSKKHLILNQQQKFQHTLKLPSLYYKPSIDVFFQSIAENYPKPGMALLLSGMGRDGAKGLRLLKEKGWHTIAQSKGSSIIFAMPRAAIKLDAVVEVLDKKAIAKTISLFVEEE